MGGNQRGRGCRCGWGAFVPSPCHYLGAGSDRAGPSRPCDGLATLRPRGRLQAASPNPSGPSACLGLESLPAAEGGLPSPPPDRARRPRPSPRLGSVRHGRPPRAPGGARKGGLVSRCRSAPDRYGALWGRAPLRRGAASPLIVPCMGCTRRNGPAAPRPVNGAAW
jgi:hypothetical protein